MAEYSQPDSAVGAAVRDLQAANFQQRPLGSYAEFAAGGSPTVTVVLTRPTPPPPDWPEEERQARIRDEQQRREEARRLLEAEKNEPATPNLDEVKVWTSEQMRPG